MKQKMWLKQKELVEICRILEQVNDVFFKDKYGVVTPYDYPDIPLGDVNGDPIGTLQICEEGDYAFYPIEEIEVP